MKISALILTLALVIAFTTNCLAAKNEVDNDDVTNDDTDNNHQLRGTTDQQLEVGSRRHLTPAVLSNYIQIKISNNHNNAGSNAARITMRFGPKDDNHLFHIPGPFLKGGTKRVNLPRSFVEQIPSAHWNDLTLMTTSGDGILLSGIKVVHSSVTILDWNPSWKYSIWLDAGVHKSLSGTHFSYNSIGLQAEILETKLNSLKPLDFRWIPQLFFAAQELGNTDGTRYDAGQETSYCSEFASWALRKAGWDTPLMTDPNGIPDTQDMKNFFAQRNRLFTRDDVLNKEYRIRPGDYLSMFNGGHSGLFLYYIGSPTNPTRNTKIRTIEGNTSGRVATKERFLYQIDAIGNAH